MLLQLDVIRVWLGQNTKKERGSIERGERDCINVNSTHSWTMPPPQWDNFLSKLQSKLPKHFSNNINSTPPRGIFLSLWFLPTHPFFYSVVQSALSISSTLTFNHKFEGCWTEGVFHFGNNKRPSKPLSTENNSAHQKCSGRSIEQTLESLFWLQKSCTFLTTEIFITKRTESLSRLF